MSTLKWDCCAPCDVSGRHVGECVADGKEAAQLAIVYILPSCSKLCIKTAVLAEMNYKMEKENLWIFHFKYNVQHHGIQVPEVRLPDISSQACGAFYVGQSKLPNVLLPHPRT